jgi:uncharacterized protein
MKPRALSSSAHWRKRLQRRRTGVTCPFMPALPDRAQLVVRVTPNARCSEFASWTADEKGRPVLLIKLRAPPVDGRANTELIRFLSKTLGCSRSDIVLLRGDTNRQKSLELPATLVAALPRR